MTDARPAPLSDAPAARRERALRSLEGLSVGDGFGERCVALTPRRLEERQEPSPPWLLTDDSMMAISLVRGLLLEGEVDQDKLAGTARFLQRSCA